MSYLKQLFIAYLHDEKGNANPGAYCNGLDNIEKLLNVDIDAEFSKDGCSTLYNRMQDLRQNPENIGKNEHTVRQYASQLNQYIKFRQWHASNEGINRAVNVADVITGDTSWMPFYMELADKLLSYKNDRVSLLKVLHKVFKDIGTKSPFYEKDIPMSDVDPFTIFGCFNKGITNANRIKTLQGFKKAFSVNAAVPTNFDGIPVLNNMMAVFFAFKNDPRRKPQDIDNLWDLFCMAVSLADAPTEEKKGHFAEKFDLAKKQFGVRWNITMGLFWIRPYSFINLDDRNRQYLGMGKAFPPVDTTIASKLKNVPSGAEYLSIIEECKNAFQHPYAGIKNFVELSQHAWIATTSTGDINDTGEENDTMESLTDIGLNTILYGPPGTGKTYHTVIYAVAIIEDKPLAAVTQEEYDDVLKRYNKYKDQGRIEFTTFHQSYGYEEFIEGIRPAIVDEGDEADSGNIQYSVQPGVFKKFCEKAERPVAVKSSTGNLGINENATIWKVSLWSTGDNEVRTECLKNGHIRIGWDQYGKDITDETDFSVDGGRVVLNAFMNKMQIGDIVLSCYSASTIDAIGVVTGEYEWHDEYHELKRLRKVNWIVKNIRENILEMNGGTAMTLASVYRLSNIAISDVYKLIEKHQPAQLVTPNQKENYVFIIDEINRGNISKIFGELITLIEATKRVGLPEGMKAVLPYSQKAFGVPKNVYIIGTMNTADRSIATIDTALRRRFFFKEMMPKPDVLAGVNVEDLSVSDMLMRMNKRIAVLYDREHTIGHAYFMPLKANPTIETLAEIFTNNIIPLLQEYFYEDYEKIRLVLGDNRKDSDEHQFIVARENDYSDLFGDIDVGLDDSRNYEINYSAFNQIEAYRSI